MSFHTQDDNLDDSFDVFSLSVEVEANDEII